MGDWRGLKRDLWEGGHRVPFIVKYPGRVPENSVNDGLVSQVDIMATLADIVGYQLPKNTAEDSKDFSKNIFSKEKSTHREELVYHAINGKFAIRKGDWVLIENNTGSVTKEPEWRRDINHELLEKTPMVLYNITEDPQQKTNLYDKFPDKVEELQSAMAEIRNTPDEP